MPRFLKKYSSFERYSLPLAGIQAVLLITTIFYSLVLVRETASTNIGNYRFGPISFSNIQGWVESEENLGQLEREKTKLQGTLLYFSHDFIAAILKYFWLVPSESIDDFLVQGAAVVLALDEYEQVRSELLPNNRFQEVEEQLIFEEVNKLVLQLIDMQSPIHQIIAMQRKSFLLMKLINQELIARNVGLSEELVLEIKADLREFQVILNAFKFGNNTLKIDLLRDQKARKSLSIIENGFESIRQSALSLIGKKILLSELSGAHSKKMGASEKLILASKQLHSQLNGTFSKLASSGNVLAILTLEILISVSFLIMIFLKEGANDPKCIEISENLRPELEENMDSMRFKENSSIMVSEGRAVSDRLEYLIVKLVDDLQSVSDFDDQLRLFFSNLRIFVGFFEFFRLESAKKDVINIAHILEESEKNKSLDGEKLSELIRELQKIVGLVSFKKEFDLV